MACKHNTKFMCGLGLQACERWLNSWFVDWIDVNYWVDLWTLYKNVVVFVLLSIAADFSHLNFEIVNMTL